MSDTVCIKTYPSRIEAEIDKNILAGAGITSIVSAQDFSGWFPPLLTGTGGARLLVNDAEAEKACEILGISRPEQDDYNDDAVDR